MTKYDIANMVMDIDNVGVKENPNSEENMEIIAKQMTEVAIECSKEMTKEQLVQRREDILKEINNTSIAIATLNKDGNDLKIEYNKPEEVKDNVVLIVNSLLAWIIQEAIGLQTT